MNTPIYICECGFKCYGKPQEEYHKSKICLQVKHLMSVMKARERLGHKNHDGLKVDGLVIHKI